jgi:hypothetical protein
MGGQSLTAAELACCANVSRSTASSHLSKLVAARLLTVNRKRRFSYYRIASPLVATMLESIKVVAAIEEPPRHQQTTVRSYGPQTDADRRRRLSPRPSPSPGPQGRSCRPRGPRHGIEQRFAPNARRHFRHKIGGKWRSQFCSGLAEGASCQPLKIHILLGFKKPNLRSQLRCS